MKRFLPLLVVLAGCSSAASSDPPSAASDIVGVDDLGTLERTFGFVKPGGAVPTADVTQGACYRALIDGQEGFEFRRYANGAAYFAKLGAGVNSGDHRPVVCVDVLGDRYRAISLSGVALDAVFRYDLGTFQGADAGMMHLNVTFERGAMRFFVGYPQDELLPRARMRPHELDFGRAQSILGDLDEIRVSDVDVFESGKGSDKGDYRISGAAANLAFRYAWRKSEDLGIFTQPTDSTGLFSKSAVILESGSHCTFQGGELLQEDDRLAFETRMNGPSDAPAAECERKDDGWTCTGL